MGNPFTSPSISAYNQNPPSDDGAQTEANRTKWASIKTKLSDPLKTLTETLVTNVNTAVGKLVGGAAIATSAISYEVTASDQGKLVRMTGDSTTLTTPDATVVGSPFVFGFVNDSATALTLDGNGSQTVNGETTATVPAGKGGWLFTDGADWFMAGQNFDSSPPLPRSYLAGLTLSNDTDTDHDIAISAGEARDAANSANLELSAVMTKQIDASWAAGDDAGGMASGVSLDVDTWYHVFLVDDGAGGTDAGFDTNITANNLQATSGVGTQYRRIGSVLTDGSANILGFTQFGDGFYWDDPPLDVDNATPGTSANTATLSVPLNVQVLAAINFATGNSGRAYWSATAQTNEAPSSTVAPAVSGVDTANDFGGQVLVLTSTSSTCRYRLDADVAIIAATLWWLDDRGKSS